MSVTLAQKASLIVAGLSVLISGPAFVLYGTQPIEIEDQTGTVLIGSDCTALKGDQMNGYVMIFSIFHITAFVVTALIVVMLYSIVRRTIYKHRAFHVKSKQLINQSSLQGLGQQHIELVESFNEGVATQSESNAIHSSTAEGMYIYSVTLSANTNLKKDGKGPTGSYTRTADLNNDTRESSLDNSEQSETDNKDSRKNITQPQGKAKYKYVQDMVRITNISSVRVTQIMIDVTMSFILSFLHCLTLIIWRIMLGVHMDGYITNTELVLYEIGLRSYFINSALNPWIYGLFNTKFTSYINNRIQVLLCCFKKLI